MFTKDIIFPIIPNRVHSTLLYLESLQEREMLDNDVWCLLYTLVVTTHITLHIRRCELSSAQWRENTGQRHFAEIIYSVGPRHLPDIFPRCQPGPAVQTPSHSRCCSSPPRSRAGPSWWSCCRGPWQERSAQLSSPPPLLIISGCDLLGKPNEKSVVEQVLQSSPKWPRLPLLKAPVVHEQIV